MLIPLKLGTEFLLTLTIKDLRPTSFCKFWDSMAEERICCPQFLSGLFSFTGRDKNKNNEKNQYREVIFALIFRNGHRVIFPFTVANFQV